MAGLIACTSSTSTPMLEDESYDLIIPVGFPEMDIPEENQLTKKRVALGKLLFYDPGLSRDSTIACASCHLQAKGFADSHDISRGIEGRKGIRNVPTLSNIGFAPYFFAEGGNPSLPAQVLGPLEDINEMGFNAALLQKRFDAGSTYDSLAQLAYGRDMDIYVMTRALASFERTLLSVNSLYDQFVQSGDSSIFTKEEKAGLRLFFSERTQCATCHPAPLFTDYSFQNVGLYEAYSDGGRYRVTLDPADHGKFKVPTLRNVALTAPYMHDGSKPTLASVITHFNQGGANHPYRSDIVHPLHLSGEEQAALVAFLQTLTDYRFTSDPRHR